MTTLEIVLLVLLVIVVVIAGLAIYAANQVAKAGMDVITGITSAFWR